MSAPTVRKQKRLQKKRAKNGVKAKAALRRRNAPKFPEIVLGEQDAPRPFIDAVIGAVTALAADHRSLLAGYASIFYRLQRVGIRELCEEIREKYEDRAMSKMELLDSLRLDLAVLKAYPAYVIMNLLPEHVISSYLPFSMFEIIPGKPRDNTMSLQFRSLGTQKTPGGIAYFAPSTPTLEIAGKRGVVAYSNHAVRRVCGRAAREWGDYWSLRPAECLLYEGGPCEPWNDGREPGFAMYWQCVEGTWASTFAEMILGKLDPTHEYWFRVGYCPAVWHDGLWVAKTLLVPGMKGTPEYDHCLRFMGTSFEQRESLRKKVQRLAMWDINDPEVVELHKRFHECGIPQIIDRGVVPCSRRPRIIGAAFTEYSGPVAANNEMLVPTRPTSPLDALLLPVLSAGPSSTTRSMLSTLSRPQADR
jgi:hypothetical protein